MHGRFDDPNLVSHACPAQVPALVQHAQVPPTGSGEVFLEVEDTIRETHG